MRFGRNHSDSSSDGQSLDSTPHKPYLLHPLRRPPGRMPGAVPPGYEEHAREDNPGVESCDLDSSSDEESENDSFSHHSRFQGVCVCLCMCVCARARGEGRRTRAKQGGAPTTNPKHATLPSARHTGLPRMLKGAFQRARIRIHVPYSV